VPRMPTERNQTSSLAAAAAAVRKSRVSAQAAAAAAKYQVSTPIIEITASYDKESPPEITIMMSDEEQSHDEMSLPPHPSLQTDNAAQQSVQSMDEATLQSKRSAPLQQAAAAQQDNDTSFSSTHSISVTPPVTPQKNQWIITISPKK